MAGETIGQRIAAERKKQNLSQAGLAAILDVSRQAISKWEADAAIPEIDKLIALSRLFGVTVGWLLGVEDAATAPEETLSEEQFKVVEELVKKYQTPPKPYRTVLCCLFAIGVSILIFLFLYSQTTRLEKHILMYNANIASLERRLEALEAVPQTSAAPGQLLAGYSFDLYPLTKTKSTHRVKVTFSAVPHVWSKENTGYLCVSGGKEDTKPFRIKCKWDGGHLTAEAVLDVADGYELCFAVEYPGGSQEQQLLENKTIAQLAAACSIPMWAEHSSFTCQDGAVILFDCTVSLRLPRIYHNISAIPNVTDCELRLYRKLQNDSQYELFRADLTNYLEHGLSADYLYQVPPQTVRFENVDIKNCNHLRLEFYVKLSSGVEGELPVTILVPDGKGGLTN